MTQNPILDELRAVREKMLADAGGTLDGLVAMIQQRERESDRKFVAAPADACEPNDSVGAGSDDLPREDQTPAR
jgi:hypothetical protein